MLERVKCAPVNNTEEPEYINCDFCGFPCFIDYAKCPQCGSPDYRKNTKET